jgi:DNA polymerase III epsilon subunit-like protein
VITCFVDVETTGLNPHRHRAWEVAVIRREDDGTETEHLWQFGLSDYAILNAEPEALRIARYHERRASVSYPAAADMLTPGGPEPRLREQVREELHRLLDGAVLVGSNPGFDASFLKRVLVENIGPWHYRPLCVAQLAAGYLHATDPELMATRADRPISSYWVSRQMGIEPPGDGVAHTALGDARWARGLYDAVTGGLRPRAEGGGDRVGQ